MRDDSADRNAIRNLMARYSLASDCGRFEALADTFAEDGTLCFSGQATTGRAAIVARLNQRGPRNAALTFTRHHLTTSMIEVDGEHATGKTYFQVLTNIGLDHCGVYLDQFIRRDGNWYFARREARADWQAPGSLYTPLQARGRVPDGD
jgi:SnoaL-like domain